MTFDFVIIGSGPAGSILAWRLAKLNFNIALVDQANSKKKIINDFFLPYVNKSPIHYNPVFSNRLGGNSVLWHSKVYLISEKEFDIGEWPFNYEELRENSRELSDLLNIEKPINLEKTEMDDKKNFYYHYSERCKFRNIFKFLKISTFSNITIFQDSSPTKINYDDKFNAKSVFIKNKIDGNKIELKINKSIIFCAGGIGNPHLILNLVPNINQNVGKFLSDHPHINIDKINSKEFINYKKILRPNIKNNIKEIVGDEKKEEVAAVYKANNTVAAVQLDYKRDPMRSLRRFFLRIPSATIRKFLNLFAYLITKLNGLIFKFGLIFGNYYKYSFEFFFSQSQEESNKVFLDDKVVDEFGLKKVNINWDVSLKDQNNYNKILDVMIGKEGFLKNRNAENEFIKNFHKSGGAGLHPSCTTKMGLDKSNSVVDKNLKINNTKNIFICGSSVFPVNGITNPTWTIMTLANRLAKYLSTEGR
jgi:hypothetical protein